MKEKDSILQRGHALWLKARGMPVSELWLKIKKKAGKGAGILRVRMRAAYLSVVGRLKRPSEPPREETEDLARLGGVPGQLAHFLTRQALFSETPEATLDYILLDTSCHHEEMGALDAWIAYGQANQIPILSWVHDQLPGDLWSRLAAVSRHIYISDEANLPDTPQLSEDAFTVLPSFVDMLRVNAVGKERIATVGLLVDGTFLSMPGHETVMEAFLYWARKDDACLWFLGEVDDQLLRRYPEVGPVVFGIYDDSEQADPRYAVDVLINATAQPENARRKAQRMAAGQWALEAFGRDGALYAQDPLHGGMLHIADALLALQTQWEAERRRTLCVRKASENHNGQAVLRMIAHHQGRDFLRRRKVTIMACTRRPRALENILDNYKRQRYPDKELLILFHTEEEPTAALAHPALREADVRAIWVNAKEISFGQTLNTGASLATGDYVTKMDDDDYYAEHYLSDIMSAFAYINAAVMGHDGFHLYFEGVQKLYTRKPGRQYRKTNFICGATLTFERSLMQKVRFRNVNTNIDGFFCTDVGALKRKIICLDMFNLLVFREKNTEGHTWVDSDAFVAVQCIPFYPEHDKLLAEHRAYLTTPPTVDVEMAKAWVTI